MKEIWLEKGGQKERILSLRGGGGSSPKNSFKFCSDGICNNANSLPECQKPAYLTNMQKSVKEYQIERFIR